MDRRRIQVGWIYAEIAIEDGTRGLSSCNLRVIARGPFKALSENRGHAEFWSGTAKAQYRNHGKRRLTRHLPVHGREAILTHGRRIPTFASSITSLFHEVLHGRSDPTNPRGHVLQSKERCRTILAEWCGRQRGRHGVLLEEARRAQGKLKIVSQRRENPENRREIRECTVDPDADDLKRTARWPRARIGARRKPRSCSGSTRGLAKSSRWRSVRASYAPAEI